jgi:hypothetical protein
VRVSACVCVCVVYVCDLTQFSFFRDDFPAVVALNNYILLFLTELNVLPGQQYEQQRKAYPSGLHICVEFAIKDAPTLKEINSSS